MKKKIYKHLAKSEDDIQKGKVQTVDKAFEAIKKELTVYEQIKLGIEQAIDYEKTKK